MLRHGTLRTAPCMLRFIPGNSFYRKQPIVKTGIAKMLPSFRNRQNAAVFGVFTGYRAERTSELCPRTGSMNVWALARQHNHHLHSKAWIRSTVKEGSP